MWLQVTLEQPQSSVQTGNVSSIVAGYKDEHERYCQPQNIPGLVTI